MLRGLTRQLTSLSAFAEARLAVTAGAAGAWRACSAWRGTGLRALASGAQAAYYSTNLSQLRNQLFNESPRSLEYTRPHWAPAPGVEESLLKRTMLRVFGFYSKEATLMRGAQGLYDCIKEAVDDKRLLEALDLPDDFQHMHSLLCLHVWLLLVRLRPEGKSGKQLAQNLYDNFQDDVERRVRGAGVKVRLNKQLVELEKQFYGSSFSYDKALKGESSEDLASTLHRNVFQKAEGKKQAAAVLSRYVRRELACLTMTDTSALFSGNLRFSALHLLPPPEEQQQQGGAPAAAAEAAAAPAGGAGCSGSGAAEPAGL